MIKNFVIIAVSFAAWLYLLYPTKKKDPEPKFTITKAEKSLEKSFNHTEATLNKIIDLVEQDRRALQNIKRDLAETKLIVQELTQERELKR
jgi:hypothetical protein